MTTMIAGQVNTLSRTWRELSDIEPTLREISPTTHPDDKPELGYLDVTRRGDQAWVEVSVARGVVDDPDRLRDLLIHEAGHYLLFRARPLYPQFDFLDPRSFRHGPEWVRACCHLTYRAMRSGHAVQLDRVIHERYGYNLEVCQRELQEEIVTSRATILETLRQPMPWNFQVASGMIGRL